MDLTTLDHPLVQTHQPHTGRPQQERQHLSADNAGGYVDASENRQIPSFGYLPVEVWFSRSFCWGDFVGFLQHTFADFSSGKIFDKAAAREDGVSN